MRLDSPRLVGLTQGVNQPSTRFRWSQYVDNLIEHGFKVTELRSTFGAYAPRSLLRRPSWLAATMVESLSRTLRSNKYDLRFLQRNLTATLCTWEPLLKNPCVFDVDDAIFLGRRGANADRIARSASLVICGNNFLADHFCRYASVTVLPTAVDTHRFMLRKQLPTRPVIGWSGSSSGLKYLYGIESAILQVLNAYPDALFKVVSDKAPYFKTLPTDRVVYEEWRPEREPTVLHSFTVGIMPLDSDIWARGKCSFKMLTYMSVGLPVVVSPIGMNLEILQQGPCGYGASSIDDWVAAISTLLSDETLAHQMGLSGRSIVEARYARNVIAPQLVQLLEDQL